MKICEFCLQLRYNGTCELGLKLPRQMHCREFDPGIEKFCSDPADVVSGAQIIQMATFFGIKGAELKKVKLMPLQQEHSRARDTERNTYDG